MAKLGISDAFSRYGARLRNVNWSVSAWAPDGSLVVSMWEHHYRRGPDGTAEYVDTASRWSGPGNSEFRQNLAEAFARKADVRLVLAHTIETAYVESGQDASKIKKEFSVRDDLIGKIVQYDGENLVLRFMRLPTSSAR